MYLMNKMCLLSAHFNKPKIPCMKNLISIAICFVVVIGATHANAQRTYINQEWSSSSGAQGVIERAASVTDNSNNVIIVSNSINSSGHTDVVVAKYDAEGVLLWTQFYDGAANGDDYGVDVAINSNNEIVVIASIFSGANNTDIALLEYSPTGTLNSATLWAGSAGGHDAPADLVIDNSNNVYVVGATEASNGFSDYIILKYNSSGVLSWSQIYNYNNLHDAATSVALSGTNLIVSGASASSSTNWDYAVLNLNASNGGITSTQRSAVTGAGLDQPLAVNIDANNNVYITGYVEQSGQKDIRTLKFDANFSLQWIANYTGTYDDIGTTVDADNAGNVYVGGSTKDQYGKTDYLLIKYNASGTQQWVKQYGNGVGVDTYGADHLVVVNNQSILVTGTVNNGGEVDFMTLSYSLSGTLQFAEDYDANGADDVASDITISGNSFYITGTSTTNGVRSTTVVKYEKWVKAETPVYDANGDPSFVDDELLIRFNPDDLTGTKINNPDIKWGTLEDFVSASALNTIGDSVGYDIKRLHCYKLYPRFTAYDTIAIAHDGDTVDLPPFYATFGVVLPADTDDSTAYMNFNSAAPQVWITAYNQYAYTLANANDPFYLSDQDGLHGAAYPNAHINIEPAWNYTTGDSSIIVGVYDSGINNIHFDMTTNSALSGSVVKDGWDYVNDYDFSTDTYPDNFGHGSAVSCIIGALRNNNGGMAGIAGGDNGNPGVTLHDMKIFDTITGSCSEQLASPISVAADAILDGAIVKNDLRISVAQHVMNHSWSYGSFVGGTLILGINPLIREAFIKAYEMGIPMVVASGNKGNAGPNPCAGTHTLLASMDDNYVLKVGGNDTTGARADFSSCSYHVDVIAPATANLYANMDNYTNFFTDHLAVDTCQSSVLNGTSFAAPHVAGVAALMLSYYNQVGAPEQFSPEDIEELMSRHATDITSGNNQVGHDDETGWGRMDAGRLFDSIQYPKFLIQHEVFYPQLNHIQSTITVPQETCIEQSYYGIAAGYADVKVHQVKVTNTHTIPYGYKLIGAWGRGSASKNFLGVQYNNTAYCLPTGIGSGAIPNASNPRIIPPDLSPTQASFNGFLYELLNSNGSGNVLGFIPPGVDTTTVATVAYTLYLVDTLGLYLEEANKIPDFKLFPNPTQDMINIQFDTHLSPKSMVSIADLTGRLVKMPLQQGSQTLTFSVNDLSPGIYFAILETEKGKRVKKFVKE